MHGNSENRLAIAFLFVLVVLTIGCDVYVYLLVSTERIFHTNIIEHGPAHFAIKINVNNAQLMIGTVC